MKTIQRHMTPRPYTIPQSAPVLEAYRLMKRHSIRHLPVLDQRQQTVGIITDRDVQRAMKVKQAGSAKQELSLSQDLLVEDFMSWPVYTFTETAPLRSAVEQMLAQKVSALLIDNTAGELVGILTTDDILRVFLSEDTGLGKGPLQTFARYFTNSPQLLSANEADRKSP